MALLGSGGAGIGVQVVAGARGKRSTFEHSSAGYGRRCFDFASSTTQPYLG